MRRLASVSALWAALYTASCIAVGAATISDAQRLSAASPAVRVGDRLFFDPRFAQFFFARCHGDVNATLPDGDSVIEELPFTPARSLTSPFRGQSMNCRQCHFGDDFLLEEPLAGRTYCDFSRRSPVPRRDDGLVRTPRNSPLMVNVGLPRAVPTLLHFDGEFATVEDLVIETLTGRNFGWLPTESSIARAHIANVIRNDNGASPRSVTYPGGGGVPYRVILLGTDPSLPPGLQLSEPDRLDVETASDEQVLLAVARLIHAYTNSLRFGTSNTGRETPSPYDLFLQKNGLPSAPQKGESDRAYAQRLLARIHQHKHWRWITDDDREFELHAQPFRFGTVELRGLEIFLARAEGSSARAHVGNCVACHTPPQFTDYRLHNNGVSQAEYDGIFGRGAFAALEIPGVAARNAHFDAYLPASPRHPTATSRFRSAPSADRPGYADLGVWNVLANPDMPKPQAALTRLLCAQLGLGAASCTPARLLPSTVALFKTPSIRDLGQSNPYFHSGAADTIEDVLRFYVATADLARAGKVRNASLELAGVRIDSTDIPPLVAFLRALDEDYR